MEDPSKPLRNRPKAYRPFHFLGNGALGSPSSEKTRHHPEGSKSLLFYHHWDNDSG